MFQDLWADSRMRTYLSELLDTVPLRPGKGDRAHAQHDPLQIFAAWRRAQVLPGSFWRWQGVTLKSATKQGEPLCRVAAPGLSNASNQEQSSSPCLFLLPNPNYYRFNLLSSIEVQAVVFFFPWWLELEHTCNVCSRAGGSHGSWTLGFHRNHTSSPGVKELTRVCASGTAPTTNHPSSQK